MKVEPWAAITVTYNPPLADGRLASQMAQIAATGHAHLVVDNASSNLAELAATVERADQGRGQLHLLPLGENRGLGEALNRGADWLRSQGSPRWLLFLDQDTCFLPDSFARLDDELAGVGAEDSIGIVGFNYHTHHLNSERPYNDRSGPARKRFMISSGTFVPTSVQARFPQDAGLFLYGIDTEYSFRLRRAGLHIVVLRNAFIDHEEGVRRTVGRSTRWVLDPYRFYYIARNSLTLFVRYGSFRELLFLPYLLSMNVAGHAQPLRSLRYAGRGVVDWTRGRRSGPMPR